MNDIDSLKVGEDGLIYINGVPFTESEIRYMLNQLMKSWNARMYNLFEKMNKWFRNVRDAMFGIPKYRTEEVLQKETPNYYLKNKFRKVRT